MNYPAFSLMTLLLLTWATQPMHAKAGEDNYEESYIYSGRMSAEDGCKLAEQALKRQAVAKQCGSLMSGGSVRFKSESADDLFRLHFETTGGRVVGFERINLKNEPFTEFEALSARCTLQAKVAVQCDQGRRDPAFIPTPESQVKLNETAFRSGETMKIAIQIPANLTGQVYVAIVQLLPYWEDEKRVWLLYPNTYQQSAPLSADNTLRLPNAAYSLDLSLPKARKSVEEALMVVFSRKPMSLPDTMTIEQFHRVLAETPLNERREVVVGYRIDAANAQRKR